MFNLPSCYRDSTLFSETSDICTTCPAFLACAAHLNKEPATSTPRREFLKELLTQHVPPQIIDIAYMHLFRVSENSAKCARKYHARKLRAVLK